ncbi:MAG TPA: hypothetical protein VFA52_01875 [Candidatus Paceibacterota bacterium]|nr:hypothetical protein [Candidatus Paceibacterota bacterium]
MESINFENKKSKTEMAIKMEIEIGLMKRYLQKHKLPKNIETEGGWTDKYSNDFREIFQRLMTENPDFWPADPSEQEAAFDSIEEELYSPLEAAA